MKRLVYNGLNIGQAESAENVWPDLTEFMRAVVLHLMNQDYYELNSTIILWAAV